LADDRDNVGGLFDLVFDGVVGHGEHKIQQLWPAVDLRAKTFHY
jgi:hypothetical protein